MYSQYDWSGYSSNRPEYVNKYLSKYKYLAVGVHQETNIPLAVIIAVAGLESNWGKSELATKANNHFGIKVKPPWSGDRYCKLTEEYVYDQSVQVHDCFRKYSLIRESYKDFGQFITTQDHYKWMLKLPYLSLEGWAEGLQDSGYATDPTYAQKLIRLIDKYQLDKLN
jgi:flagellum-specific peptidoglycan hydrolase FlgJ